MWTTSTEPIDLPVGFLEDWVEYFEKLYSIWRDGKMKKEGWFI